MKHLTALCVVLCVGASGSSVAEMEALRSVIAEHDIDVTVYVAETPPCSDIQDLLSAAALQTIIVRRPAESLQHYYTAPAGNSKYVMRDVRCELPQEARLWPGHLYRRRCLVRRVSA